MLCVFDEIPMASVFFICFLSLVAAEVSGLGYEVEHEGDVLRTTMEHFSGHLLTESVPSPVPLSLHKLLGQIEELSTFSDSPPPSVTRVLYTEKDVLARRYIKGLMESAGLSVREDAVGNMYGRWEGSDPEIAAVATGSHIDAIPYSGKYDGVVGVLGAIEAISILKRSGFKPKRALEVVMFTSEEPTRFGISCIGSRLLAGSSDLVETLKTSTDGNGVSFLDAARDAGYTSDADSLFLKEGTYSAFVEMHIEQGPILEDEGVFIGIVTAIAAPASIKVDFQGSGGHAGAVLMPNRNDAGLAAAELALAVEKHVYESGSIDTVGTIGVLELHPGAINSIPSRAHMEIDLRDIDESRRNSVIKRVRDSAESIAEKRGVQLSEFKIVNQDPPAVAAGRVIEAIKAASRELGLTTKLMISRAYHDSLFMARISPMGMIFIPCHKGYSHKPEEYASPGDIENGVRVLAGSMAKLSLS